MAAFTPPLHKMVHTLRAAAWLLRYPDAELRAALPALAAALHALRALAPTRPVAAGAACGAFAGALAAIGYALACSETSSAFVALWYTLGVALSAAAGALLGPRVLRW